MAHAPAASSWWHTARRVLARHRVTLLTVGLVVYTLALAVAVGDEVLNLGLFPTRLQRMARELIARFDHPEPTGRQAAADELVGTIEPFVAIPELIRALDAPSPAVRALAAECLRRITATAQGYDPTAPPAEREQAIRRWRQWWRDNEVQF